MKDGLVHVCFVIDESGSMWDSTSDVVGGFKKVITEQKAVKDGGCIVSLYKFSDKVSQIYLGKDVNEIDEDKLVYSPGGCTAMNDGIGRAIDEIGKWLADKDESERPEKNLIVIMTDGYENASHEYTIEQVRERIKHQTEKYNWSFIYMGTDVTDSTYANSIVGGISGCTTSYNSRSNYAANYNLISSGVKSFRRMANVDTLTKSALFDQELDESAEQLTAEYEKETGNVINRA